MDVTLIRTDNFVAEGNDNKMFVSYQKQSLTEGVLRNILHLPSLELMICTLANARSWHGKNKTMLVKLSKLMSPSREVACLLSLWTKGIKPTPPTQLLLPLTKLSKHPTKFYWSPAKIWRYLVKCWRNLVKLLLSPNNLMAHTKPHLTRLLTHSGERLTLVRMGEHPTWKVWLPVMTRTTRQEQLARSRPVWQYRPRNSPWRTNLGKAFVFSGQLLRILNLFLGHTKWIT